MTSLLAVSTNCLVGSSTTEPRENRGEEEECENPGIKYKKNIRREKIIVIS